MKILQINSVYKKGSTGKIVYDIHTFMQEQGHKSIVCYGRGENITETNIYKTCSELYSKFNNLCSRFTGIMYGGCLYSTQKLIDIIKKEQPDIVHLQCINGYFVNIYKLVSYLKKNKIKTVLTLHAEFMYTGNCGHAMECERWKVGCGNCPRLFTETKSVLIDNTSLSWKKMQKAFEQFNILAVVSVSSWLQRRAEQSPILADKYHLTILNGIDTSVFRFIEGNKLRTNLQLDSKKIVFHVTAGFSEKKEHLKGGYYVLEIAYRFWNVDPNVIFLIAGNCDKVVKTPPNTIFLGNIDDQNMLAEYYSMADVTLLTSKKETFSMVVAESLCCGTPVVGFEAGGPENITINEVSSFVPFGDEERLFKEIEYFIFRRKFNKHHISSMAKSKYSKETMGKDYLSLYSKLISEETE